MEKEEEWNLKFTIFYINSYAINIMLMNLF